MATNQSDSPRAVAARLNGAKSKGPKTEAGKARSSQNALKHGLCAESDAVAPGDPEGFLELQAGMHARYRPRHAQEVALVERVVSLTWRLQRIAALENVLLGGDRPDTVDIDAYKIFGQREHQMSNLCRYESALDRHLHRAIKALKESLAEEYGKVPIEPEGDVAEEKQNEPKPAESSPEEDSNPPELDEREAHRRAMAGIGATFKRDYALPTQQNVGHR